MSSSGDGDKPAQTGLVDMGDISFYNHSYNPSFNLSEIAPYQGSFSELVLNVTWAQLQPSEGGPLTTSASPVTVMGAPSIFLAHSGAV